MSRFTLSRRRSVLVALLLAFAVSAAAGFFGVGTTDALPCNEVDRLYYSDASYTNLVGERLLLCNGQFYQWGVVTSFVKVYTFPCGNCGNW